MYEKIVRKIMFNKLLRIMILIIVSALILFKINGWNEPVYLVCGIVISGALVSAFIADAFITKKKISTMENELKTLDGTDFREIINNSSRLDTYIVMSGSHIISFSEYAVFPLSNVKSITKFITNNEDEKTKYSLYFRYNDGSFYDVLFSHKKNLDEAYKTICGNIELPLSDDVIVGKK